MNFIETIKTMSTTEIMMAGIIFLIVLIMTFFLTNSKDEDNISLDGSKSKKNAYLMAYCIIILAIALAVCPILI